MAQAAVKPDPKGGLLSISQIAKKCGLHRTTCRDRLEDLGYEPDPSSTAKNQLYFFDDEMEFAIKSAKDTGSAMKIRQMRADAQTREFKLAVLRRDYVPASEMVEIVQSIVSNIFQELTVRQGKRIDSKLAKAKSVIEIKKIRNGDNSRIMKMLKANFEEFIG